MCCLLLRYVHVVTNHLLEYVSFYYFVYSFCFSVNLLLKAGLSISATFVHFSNCA